MRVEFAGEFAELQRFADRIEKMPRALVTVSEQLAEETIELIREGFESSTDPDGNPWKPPLLRDGKPLEDTGGLKSSWHRKFAVAHGFGVANAKSYAIHNQRGTGIYGPRHKRIYPITARALRLGKTGLYARSVAGAPARKMVPDHGLPERWRRRYLDTAQEVLTEVFRK